MADLKPGDVFAGHRIEGVAGRGGVGVVYRARHLALDHLVALKVISPGLADDPAWRARFVAESRAAVSIRHPNVVAVHHAGEEDGVMFVTMDLVDGIDLRRVIREQGPLHPDHAVEVIGAVASALDAAHENGLVHRDVKPSNVLIEFGDGDGGVGLSGGERVYLTDFGLTKRLDSSADVTASGAFVGTIDYVAPEQIQGERIDARTDVYALGCVLYETILGQAPFAGLDEKVAKLYAHLQEMPEPLSQMRPGIPKSLDGVVERAMAKDRHERYGSAGDLARAAAGAIEGQDRTVEAGSVARGEAAPESGEEDAPETEAMPPPATVEPTEAQPPPVRRQRSRPPGGAIAALATLVAGAVALALVLGGGDEGGSTSTPPPPADSPASIKLPGFPVGVGVGEEGVWVGQRQGNSVTLLKPSGGRKTFDFGQGSAPEGVTIGPASVWVALQGYGEMGRISRTKLEQDGPPDGVGAEPRASAHEGGALWVTDGGSDQVTRLTLDRKRGGKVTDTQDVGVGPSPSGIALGEGGVWVTNRDGDSVTRIEDTTAGALSVTDPEVAVGDNPKGIAVSDGTVWVADTGKEGADDGQVTPIDAKSHRPDQPLDVGGDPRGVAAGLGFIWVANGAGYISKIDPGSSEEVDRIDIGKSPEEVAIDPNANELWVTDGVGGRIYHFAP